MPNGLEGTDMELRSEMAFTKGLIRKTARRMIGSSGIVADDVPDIQQDLWLDLLERMQKYNQDKGSVRAFVVRVVRNKSASIIRSRRAAKRRGDIGILSLNLETSDVDGESIEFQDLISVDDYLRLTRGATRTECERHDLAIDVRAIVSHLTPAQRVICLLLVDRNVCDVANVAGIPRSTLRGLIARLRLIGHDVGLEKYLE